MLVVKLYFTTSYYYFFVPGEELLGENGLYVESGRRSALCTRFFRNSSSSAVLDGMRNASA